MNGPQLPFLAPGEEQHPHLSMLALRNVPIKVEAFPELFLDAATLPKAVDWTRAFVTAHSLVQWLTRSCFYAWSFARQPVHDSVFKVL
jgi:hypothetical protein